MKRMIFAAVVLAAGAGLALADSDMIQARRTMMKGDGAAAKALVDMAKGAAPFDLATVQKSLATFQEVAAKSPGMFPPDSKDGDTNATAAVWDNKADFDARFAKFGADAKAAAAAIKDEATFKASIMTVLGNCGSCHEVYKKKA